MADRKDSPSVRPSAPDLEILGDQVTLHPSGYIEPSEKPHDGDRERTLMGSMARFRSNPLEYVTLPHEIINLNSLGTNANFETRFLREVSLHVSGTGWRAYDNVIGQPMFYSGFSDQMTAAVLSAPILQKRITDLAEKRIAVEEKEGLLDINDPLFEAKRTQRKSAIEYSLHELCERMTGDMICKFESKPFIRGAYYFCTQLLTRAYHQGLYYSSI